MRLITLLLTLVIFLSGCLQLSWLTAQAASSSQPTMVPVELGVSREALSLTDDIPTAEAQAAAHPTDPEAQFLLAIAYSRSPYIEKALDVLQRTKRLVKNRQERLATMDRLIASYEAALNVKPKDTRLLYRLAFGYYLKGAGLKRYQQANPVEQLAWLHRANKALTEVIALDPADIWARNYLGFVLAEEATEFSQPEKIGQAEAEWNYSLQVNPVNPGAYWLLAQLYIKQGNLLKAAQFAEKGIQAREAMLKPG